MEPELENEPEVEAEVEAEPFVLPEDFADRAKEWGLTPDEIAEAVQVHKALQTEEGVVDAFIRTGQNLGFGIKELNRLFDDEPVAPVAAPVTAPVVEEDDDPERLMTVAEVRALVEQERAERTQSETQREQAAFQSRQAALFGQIDSWFDTNGIKDEDERRLVAQLAEKTILPGQDSYDPAVALAALERGKASYEAFIEKQATAYLTKKGKTIKDQPTVLSGGGTNAGDGGDEAPDYAALGSTALTTAKERVRNRLRASGELD